MQIGQHLVQLIALAQPVHDEVPACVARVHQIADFQAVEVGLPEIGQRRAQVVAPVIDKATKDLLDAAFEIGVMEALIQVDGQLTEPIRGCVIAYRRG